MPNDVFGRRSDILGGVMTADQVSVNFAGTGGGQNIAEAGMLMQSVSLQYSQQFSMLFELNSPKVFYVAGRPSGQAVANRILGIKAIQQAFYTRFGDVCNARGNTMVFGSQGGGFCDDGTGSSVNSAPSMDYTTSFNVITQLAISVESQRMLIGENITLAFGSMSAGQP